MTSARTSPALRREAEATAQRDDCGVALLPPWTLRRVLAVGQRLFVRRTGDGPVDLRELAPAPGTPDARGCAAAVFHDHPRDFPPGISGVSFYARPVHGRTDLRKQVQSSGARWIGRSSGPRSQLRTPTVNYLRPLCWAPAARAAAGYASPSAHGSARCLPCDRAGSPRPPSRPRAWPAARPSLRAGW